MITDESLRLNFTNEGGVNGTTRLLKNVMGLWMLRCCRQSWAAQGREYDYRELMELASREKPFQHLVDPDDEIFLCPDNMRAMPSTLLPQDPAASSGQLVELT